MGRQKWLHYKKVMGMMYYHYFTLHNFIEILKKINIKYKLKWKNIWSNTNCLFESRINHLDMIFLKVKFKSTKRRLHFPIQTRRHQIMWRHF